MNTEQVYLEKIAQYILIEMIKDGVIPSSEKLIDLVRQTIKDKNLLTPLSAQEKPVIAFGERASANKFNNIINGIIDDLDVAYELLLSTESTLADSTIRTLLEMRKVEGELSGLLQRVDRLLLTADQTEGLLAFFGDSFVDNSMIDLEESDCYIDLSGQAVHLPFYTDEVLYSGMEQVLSQIRDEDIQISPLLDSIRRFPGTRDSVPTDMLRQSDRPWIYTVRTDRQLPYVGIEIKIDLRKAILPPIAALKIGKILLDPFITNNSIVATVQSSMDGQSWTPIPVEQVIRTISEPTLFLFEEKELQFVRIVLSKSVHDRIDGGYVYDFGIRKFAMYGHKSLFATEGTLQSTVFSAKATDGSLKKITQAVLSKACADTPDNTSIEYFIAPVTIAGDVSTIGEFSRVGALNKRELGLSSVLNFSELSDFSVEVLPTRTLTFPFKGDVTNSVLDGVWLEDKNVKVWRDLGTIDGLYLTRQADGKIKESGWTVDGPYYTTYAYNSKDGITEIDFGPRSLFVDDLEVSGKVRLTKGVHKFKVHEQNWLSLEGLTNVTNVEPALKRISGTKKKYGATGFETAFTGEPISTVSQQVIDTLYPYNHKLLIEGLNYSGSFNGERVYQGLTRFAAYYMQKTNSTDFGLELSGTNYSKFCTVNVAEDTDHRVMVKWTANGDLSSRERFRIECANDGGVDGLVFRAVLKTINPKRTPTLEGYEIKVV